MIRPKYESPKPAKRSKSRADEIEAREYVNLRDAGVCVRCRRVHPLFGVNFDHRKNKGQGGPWSASNGQLLCGSGTTGCHGWKTDHPTDAVTEGWAVPGWDRADPLKWPARRWLRTDLGTLRLAWVIYDDFGSWTEITHGYAFVLMTDMGWAA